MHSKTNSKILVLFAGILLGSSCVGFSGFRTYKAKAEDPKLPEYVSMNVQESPTSHSIIAYYRRENPKIEAWLEFSWERLYPVVFWLTFLPIPFPPIPMDMHDAKLKVTITNKDSADLKVKFCDAYFQDKKGEATARAVSCQPGAPSQIPVGKSLSGEIVFKDSISNARSLIIPVETYDGKVEEITIRFENDWKFGTIWVYNK